MSKLGHLADKLLENTPWQKLKEKMLVTSLTTSKNPVDGSRTVSSSIGSFTLAEQPDLLLSRNDDDKYTQRLLFLEKKSPLSSQSPVGTSSAKKIEVIFYLLCTRGLCSVSQCGIHSATTLSTRSFRRPILYLFTLHIFTRSFTVFHTLHSVFRDVYLHSILGDSIIPYSRSSFRLEERWESEKSQHCRTNSWIAIWCLKYRPISDNVRKGHWWIRKIRITALSKNAEQNKRIFFRYVSCRLGTLLSFL